MKKFCMAVVMMAVCSLGLAADFPKYEVFGGYSVLKADISPSTTGILSEFVFGSSSAWSHGFDVAVTRNLNPWLGVKASFSANMSPINIDGSLMIGSTDYEADPPVMNSTTVNWNGDASYKRFTFVAGPEFSYRKHEQFRPFAHVLFGFSKMSANDVKLNLSASDGESSIIVGGATGKFDCGAGFAMTLGGGVDMKVSKKVNIRLIELDYMPTYNNTTITGNFFEGSDSTMPTRHARLNIGSGRFNNMKIAAGIVINID